jgi:predicted RNase H-like HicB family nuclease
METVDVVYHQDPEGWWADSAAVPGWTATAETLDELRSLVEDGVRFALARDDVVIEHLLNYEVPAHAYIVFDFVAGQTVVSPGFSGEDEGSRRGAHWQPQPA